MSVLILVATIVLVLVLAIGCFVGVCLHYAERVIDQELPGHLRNTKAPRLPR